MSGTEAATFVTPATINIPYTLSCTSNRRSFEGFYELSVFSCKVARLPDFIPDYPPKCWRRSRSSKVHNLTPTICRTHATATSQSPTLCVRYATMRERLISELLDRGCWSFRRCTLVPNFDAASGCWSLRCVKLFTRKKCAHTAVANRCPDKPGMPQLATPDAVHPSLR